MITNKQMNIIAKTLEDKFNDEFMAKVKKVFDEIQEIYDQHTQSGNWSLCKEANIRYDNVVENSDGYWERIWFHPEFNDDGCYASFTKGLGVGCHFGDKESVKNCYERYHDKVFGYHFHPTNWAGNEGYSTRKSALEFVMENANNGQVIINTKTRIDELINNVLPHIESLPSVIRKAIDASVKMAKDNIDNNDNQLLKSFSLN